MFSIIVITLNQKVTVFGTTYFPASSYPVFVFLQNNHGCLSVMQSLQYKNLCKAVSKNTHRERESTDQSRQRQTKAVGKE